MTSCYRRFGTFLAVLPLLALSGCTGTDVLDTGNTRVTVSVQVVNNSDIELEFPSATGGTLVKISEIVLKPLDPVEVDALGTSSLAVFSLGFIDVFLASNEVFTEVFQLSTGRYSIDFIQFQDIQLQAATPLSRCEDGTTVCIDGSQCTGIGGGSCVSSVVCGSGSGGAGLNWQAKEAMQLKDIGVLTVSGTDDQLNIVIDGRLLIDTLVAVHAPEPNCDFDKMTFENLLGTFITTDLE